MGGIPAACFLSLVIPPTLPLKWLDEFLRGLLQLARRFDVTLAGGDTSGGEKITADIVVLGTVPAGKALLRSGARSGDQIYVTGELGESAAVLKRLFAGTKTRPAKSNRHFYPMPRVEAGWWLRERNLASSMIDISDGLSVDLGHVCEESRASALIEASAIPISKVATLEEALHGGDDYELLFTARPRVKIPSEIHGVAVTRIGTILSSSAGHSRVQIRDNEGGTKLLKTKGWQHFAKFD
jgi:thiamine-monophosphate kinase